MKIVQQTTLKISIIGCGHWGKNLVRNLSELGCLSAVSDINQELLIKIADTYSVKAQTPDEVFESDVDAVVIAAPAVQHYELAYRALESNKHVFVEKPIALDIQEAKQLCDLALSKKKVLMVGHLLQYHPAFLALKNMVDEGRLRKLQYIYSNRLSLGKFRNEENILWSFAPHDISMILSLTNEMPESVYATGACHLNADIQDVTTTHLAFKSGVQAHNFVSWLHPYKEQKLIVIGDRGMLVFNDGLPWAEKLQHFPHQVNWSNGIPKPEKAEGICVPLPESEPLKLECQHFIDCITQKKTPRTDAEEGLRVLTVLDAAQRSLQSKRTIQLNNQSSKYFAHESAVIDDDCMIGEHTKIWHFSHVLKGAKIGRACVIGQNVMVGPEVIIGNGCKIQNNVSVYKGVTLEEDVFCGPSCVFTNVHNPRASVERKDEFRSTYVEKGATIGANATILCGHRIGAYSLIGAGAVVTKDVKPHAVMVGSPAKQIGWVSHAGEKLGGDLICPREGRCYQVDENNNLQEMTQNVSSIKTVK